MISSLLYRFNHAPCWRGEMEVWERRMTASSLDRLLYLGLHRSGWMGKEEASLLRKLVRPGMRVIDVGANVGLYSLFLAQLIGETGSVLAFEPEPNLFAMLVANCERNAARNVTPMQRALGSCSGLGVLQRSAFNSGDNRLAATGSSNSENTEVEIIRFDDLQPLASPDFIKVDVQGHELDVLLGMDKAIARNPDVRVLFEFSPSALRAAGNSPEALLSFFEQRRFHLYQTEGGQLQAAADSKRLIAVTSGHQYINLLASRNRTDA